MRIPLRCLAIFRELLRQELQGDIATQPGVLGLVDLSPAALADLLRNLGVLILVPRSP